MASGNEESKISKFVETFLTCQHCKKLFQKPVVLLCSHSFCRDCLGELLQSDESVTCPVCQENILLPKNGIEAVKSNSFLEFLLKYVTLLQSFGSPEEPKGKCKLCEGDGIKVYCQECLGPICNICEAQHVRMKPFKGHTVIQLSDMLQGDIADVIRMLSKGEAAEECPSHHGEPLRFFCQRCHTAVCRDCTVVDHNTGDHRVSSLEEITDARRRTLGDVLEKLNERRERNSNFIKGKDEIMRNILDQKIEIENAIDNIATEIIQSINTQKTQLLDQLEKITNAKLTGNEKIFEAAEKDQDEMTNCCAMSDLLLSTARDVELIQVNNEFIHALKKQNSKLENFSFASQITRLGIIFVQQAMAELIKIGHIKPIQYDQKDRVPTSSWSDELGSFRDFSNAFWNSLKE